MSADTVFDHQRPRRTGLPEAVLCAPKTPAQIDAILREAANRGESRLLTRLSPETRRVLTQPVDYDELSATAYFGGVTLPSGPARVALVTAGTGDLPVAREAARTLGFLGIACEEFVDLGVAGLWRLLDRVEELRRFAVVIAVAGMEGALFSVLAGLIPGVVIAVPSSVGYGVAQGGEAALRSALASCAPGVLVVNIDNGFGAACAARRVLGATAVGAQAGVVPASDGR